MRMKKGMKMVSAVLMTSLIFQNTTAIYASSVKKSEAVYVKLRADGGEEDITVSDWLLTDKKIGKIEDKSNLDDIYNVKNNVSPVKNGDELSWNTEEGDIYYQGKTDKSSPIGLEVHYFVDGIEYEVDEMVGKSGKLKIELLLKNNEKHKKVIKGKEVSLATPFSSMIVTGFPIDRFKNIEVDHGKIISDGNRQIVIMVGAPGLKESLMVEGLENDIEDLGISSHFTITADTENFEMGVIGVVSSPEIPETLKKLKDSDTYKEWKEKKERFEKDKNLILEADKKEELETIYTDSKKTERAKILVKNLLDFYELDRSLLTILPDYVTKENIDVILRLSENSKNGRVGEVLDSKFLQSFQNKSSEEAIKKGKKLIKDYEELQKFDEKRLDKVKEIMKSSDELSQFLGHSMKFMGELKTHEKEIKTLEKVVKYEKELSELMQSFEKIESESRIDEEDEKVMVEALIKHKTEKLMEPFKTAIKEDGTVQNPEVLIGVIEEGKQAGMIKEEDAIGLISLVKRGNVGAKGTTYHTAISQMLEGAEPETKKVIAFEVAKKMEELKALSVQVKTLKKGLKEDLNQNDSEEIKKSIEVLKGILPEAKNLQNEAVKNQKVLDEIKAFSENKEDLSYLKLWVKKFQKMRAEMEEEKETVEFLKEMLEELESPLFKNFRNYLPLIGQDMKKLRPSLTAFFKELDSNEGRKRLESSPETMRTLVKMNEALSASRDIADIMRIAMDDRVITAFRDLLEMKKDFSENQKIDAIEELFERADELSKLSDGYEIFTEKKEGMISDVKFIMQTAEIRKEKVKKEYETKKSKRIGFFSWMKKKIESLWIF